MVIRGCLCVQTSEKKLVLLICISRITSIMRPVPPSLCIPVVAGADKHGQAGAGAASAVVGRGLRGGEVGGAGAQHRPAEPEHRQHDVQHVSVHQVACCSHVPYQPFSFRF